MFPELRKVVTYDEVIYREGVRAAEPPLRLIGVAAVVKNPWHGRGYVEDLSPEINRIAPLLGKMLTDMLIGLAGSGDAIEAYGKAAMAGTDCELEHGSALIHTLRFGNFYREAVGAKTYLGFTNSRGPANTQIQIPLMDKHDSGRRSHYLTVQFSIPDAPGHDELVAALGASTGGRPHHRIGDRYADLKSIGRDIENPAGV
ncbi:amino acid synthesis family protein [Cypionkella sp.]|uniref:amino acid synthesis family protein n=1 Tax=Cypionkella sp. TaxID=2811411 RepID=UPI002726DEC8|nr:amino acid synthesis family protein [Cypionkella sp.]MDO8983697.1 amino acid synthesis family protein [Cypionkella sp.]MDP2050068.1 amino acid synthesis family protein [Cypionkella sp.]